MLGRRLPVTGPDLERAVSIIRDTMRLEHLEVTPECERLVRLAAYNDQSREQAKAEWLKKVRAKYELAEN